MQFCQTCPQYALYYIFSLLVLKSNVELLESRIEASALMKWIYFSFSVNRGVSKITNEILKEGLLAIWVASSPLDSKLFGYCVEMLSKILKAKNGYDCFSSLKMSRRNKNLLKLADGIYRGYFHNLPSVQACAGFPSMKEAEIIEENISQDYRGLNRKEAISQWKGQGGKLKSRRSADIMKFTKENAEATKKMLLGKE